MMEQSAYQVSSSCIQPLASLRSEEIILKKICLRLFVGCGHHKYMGVPRFTFVHPMVSKFDQ